jgi:hypothetical protein
MTDERVSRADDMDAGRAMAERGDPPGSEELIDESECDVVEVDVLEAKAAALASVSTVELSAKGSAIGKASVEGDAEVSNSVVGMVNAGSVGLYRGAALVMVGDGESAIEQGFAEVVVSRAVGLNKSGAGVVVAGDASVARSWVGVMAARNAVLSGDSRVIIDMKAVLVLAAALLGGFGLIALAIYYLMPKRRMASLMRMDWMRPHGVVRNVADRVSHFDPHDLAKLAEVPAVALMLKRLHLNG